MLATIGGLRRDGRSSALVEFAIVGSFLATTAASLGDAGIILWRLQEVHEAARAGIQYAAQHGYNQTAMQSAATSTTSLAVTATASSWCGCAGASGTTSATCGSTCASGYTAGTYAQITVTNSFTPVLGVLWGSRSAITLSSTLTTRAN